MRGKNYNHMYLAFRFKKYRSVTVLTYGSLTAVIQTVACNYFANLKNSCRETRSQKSFINYIDTGIHSLTDNFHER